MKQSTKLLSLVLALVMAISCMSVIGNAALVKSEISWDNIDDAQLTAEQVADLALDLVDNDLLADMETIDLSILGELRLNKIDYILEDITGLRDSLVWGIGSGLLGSIGDLDFDPLLQSGEYGLFSSHTAYQRSHGDIEVIMALLEFIGNDNNSELLSNAAYGIGTDAGVDLGLIGSFLDLGSLGDSLADIPGMLTELVYDLLVHGSYGEGYENSSYPSVEDLGGAGATLPTNVDTIDEMVDHAIATLLTAPQNYTWEGEGDAATKVWDMNSLPLPTAAGYGYDTVKNYFSIVGSGSTEKNSLFQLIDKVAPFAIYDMGVSALNNNLKKALMEIVDVDLNEVNVNTLPADVKTAFEVDAVDGQESYVTYIAYDKLVESGDNWYYTTLESETVVDATGAPVLDEEGNEQSEKVRKFFKANTAGANDFFYLIDWGWEFYAPVPLSGDATIDDLSELNYEALIANYGSITESLNQIVYIVFETAITQEIKDDFADLTGDYWLGDGVGEANYPTSATVTDENGNETSVFMYNATRVLKYLLAEHADKMFGSTSPYVDWTYDDVADKTISEIIAIIGPTFFEDVMPQLIMPKNADGTYAFHDGVQILEFGSLVIREFITEIAPNVNYDSYIFAEGTVTSVNDRQFKVQDAETWYNIILNMGLDIAYTYLNNITNFNTAIPTQNITEDRWKGMLNSAVTWAANYVSDGTNSVIHGFEPSKIAAYSDPLDKLSYILNTLLPLGFINGCTSSSFDFDVSILFDKAKALLTDFDLTNLISLFGRNTASTYNFMDDANIVTAVVDLVNNILNLVLPISENGDGKTTLLQATKDDNGRVSADSIISQANLKITIQQLLRVLYAQGRDLLNCALPVLGMFIKGWGTEQQFNPPQISLDKSIDLKNGATEAAINVSIRNASNGVWRHYKDASGTEHTDEQYKIILKSVNVYDQFEETNASAYVTTTMSEQTLDYGATGTFSYTAANVPTSGALVRFKVGYQVLNEDGAVMSNGKIFYAQSYAWLNYNPTDAKTNVYNDSKLLHTSIYTPQYVGISGIKSQEDIDNVIGELSTSYFGRDYQLFTSNQTGKITNNTGTVDGLTFASLSQKFANSSGGRYLRDIKNFKTYTHTYVNEDGEDTSDKYNVTGSANYATWAAANKTSGSTSTWSISLTDKDATETYNFVLRYYDDVAYNKLTNLAASEMGAVRLASNYNLNGTAYAGGILTSANSTDDEGEIVYRDSNFKTLVWIANEDAGKWAGSYTAADGSTITETVTTYEASSVTDIVEETDEDGNVISASGKVTVNGEEIAVKKVTAIDCATAVNAYVPAFVNGVQGGMQAFNANSVYDFAARYETLYVAANDVRYCAKSVKQVINEGNGENIDAAVTSLKADVDTLEATYSDTKDYTDYKMYRWNRYNDARDDAKYFINLQNDASNATVAEIDESFPYTWIEEDDLRDLVAGDQYEQYITALLEPLDEEEVEAKAEWLEAKKLEYSTQTLLDVEMADNLVNRVSGRLLARDHGIITKYLDDEITSANNMVKAQSNYTARSWAKYETAMQNALEVQAAPTQMTVFDAKYELMTARNELVLVGEEADYSELETLIAQAQMVMANTSLYDNTNKEIGQVLAELGYVDLENAEGEMVQLFPMSALYVNAEPYGVDDQDEIDDAATALKEALARLRFKGNTTIVGVSEYTLVEADEANDVEAVVADAAKIAACQYAEAVKDLFTVTDSESAIVTNDIHYSVDTDVDTFVGTSSTITYYKTVNGVNVPCATFKLIVDGDVNGDGVVDVLDATMTELTAYDHAELQDFFFIAGNLDTATEEIEVADYSAVVNKALA